jgi:hypothetical protein
MRTLSKTKLLAYRQCPKRLWLEVNRPELRQDSASTQASFAVGNEVGDVARRLYDPAGKGELIDVGTEGFDAALARSRDLLAGSRPIFEAGFKAGGALAFADVMLPVRSAGKRVWRMIEVKASTDIEDYHRDDTAIQSFIARAAGVPLASISLAHVDNTWVYPGSGDYQGLLAEHDLTEETESRADEVKAWITEAQKVAAKRVEPAQGTGAHCTKPYECGFLGYCQGQEPQAKYPVAWIPDIRTKVLKSFIADSGVRDLREVPDELLNERQHRVKKHTLSRKTFFDAENAAAELAAFKLPAVFVDFETIQFAVPVWKGTRPYQKIPYQFSLHRLSRTGKLEQESFLDLSGNDPSRLFAEALIAACGERGPVYVYNAAFEKTIIRQLGERYPRLKRSLSDINDRVVDLLKVAQQHYYHPSQQGSWSIKNVLPAVAPDLRYDDLDEVQNGGTAMNAFREAIAPDTSASRKVQIRQQLLDYCALDTYAMVRLWQFFAGRRELSV